MRGFFLLISARRCRFKRHRKKSVRASDLLIFPKPGIIHCLSYTAVLANFLPFESVPLTVTVRLLPSAATTTRPVMVTLLSFLLVNVKVLSLTILYDRESELGSPVTG